MNMFGVITVLIMLAVTYAMWREGLLTAAATFFNVILSGLIAYSFFEPLATMLEPMFLDSFLAGLEDFISLMLIFCSVLGGLRLATNSLAYTEPEYPMLVQQVGGAVFGLLTGYFLSGILICSFLTMPIPKGAKFMGHNPLVDSNSPSAGLRGILPPDRMWLAFMHRAGRTGLASGEDTTFDPNGNFQLRYDRYHRYGPDGKFVPFDGVLPPEKLKRQNQ